MAMEANELRAALEAILFLSSDPVRIDDLAESLDETKEAVAAQLDDIKRNLDERVGGFMLEQAAGGWRLTTRAEHDSVLKKYFAKKGENRLSLAALETLAIVAYRQPITAPEVSDIRGVNSSSSIRTLLERRMIRVGGRKNVVGSPFLYRTTKDFLVHFGLNDIRDLPRLEEFGDLIGENINEDLVAAINAAPEPTGEGIIEEPNESAPEGETTPSADEGTSLEEQSQVAADETQLESSRTEVNED
ncbi:MAG TPA: SMC-Scp complex subunit ScpB [Thermoanaerobaculia bacterium]|nr:SMC-Scp complex subunit ScpB [Thermoanaerobaculia bacterium]